MQGKLGIVAAVLGGLLLIGSAVPSQAFDSRKDCEKRADKLENEARKEESKGHRKEAEQKRREAEKVRQQCREDGHHDHH